MEAKLRAKETALALVFLIFLIGYLAGNQKYFWIAGIIALLAMVSNFPFVWLSKIWFGLPKILGWFSTRIVLSIIFYLFLTPIGWLYRKFHRNLLSLKNNSSSLFIKRDKKFNSDDLINPF